MAGYRQIHTQIWKDEWFIELSPEEKLLFIYLFSNDLASISGIYRIPLTVIANESGLSKTFIQQALKKFEQQQRVVYDEGTMWVVNMMKYHQSASQTVQTKVQRDADMVSDGRVKRAYLEFIETGIYPIDTLSIGCVYPPVKDKDKGKDKVPPIPPKPPKTPKAPAPYMDNEAVNIYREVFKKTPNEFQRKEIAEKIIDCALWKAILVDWALHDYKPGSVPGQIEAYLEGGLKKNGQRPTLPLKPHNPMLKLPPNGKAEEAERV